VALPAADFASRGMVNRPLGRRLSLLFLMGGMQGLVGWWMVRSGLKVSASCIVHSTRRIPAQQLGWYAACSLRFVASACLLPAAASASVRLAQQSSTPTDPMRCPACCAPKHPMSAMSAAPLQEPEGGDVPRVSTYRMAGHLLTAFTIYSALVWTALSVALPWPPTVVAGPEAAHAARLLGRYARPLAALVGVTAMSGCFVAGKDAGRAYNTWPDMNGEWFPSEYFSERLPGGWMGGVGWGWAGWGE
jgi:heme A synthase